SRQGVTNYTRIDSYARVIINYARIDLYTWVRDGVFPAEACETIGGEACWANIFPEVRLQASADSDEAAAVALEEIDREYLHYAAQSKTVFPGEACDDLGGEFCGAEFLNGIF
ncbi:Light-regulated protein, partial [Cucurbita argyrosperma subsp. argyrosperma]